jgi:hypothetical protein
MTNFICNKQKNSEYLNEEVTIQLQVNKVLSMGSDSFKNLFKFTLMHMLAADENDFTSFHSPGIMCFTVVTQPHYRMTYGCSIPEQRFDLSFFSILMQGCRLTLANSSNENKIQA